MRSVQLIERQARKELAKFYKKQWCDHGRFMWPEWPLRSSHWKVLIMAARSSKIGCNGGLVNERGNLNSADWILNAMAVLERDGMLEDRRVTDLGWAMIEHFRTDEEIEPKTKPKGRGGVFRRGGRCR